MRLRKDTNRGFVTENNGQLLPITSTQFYDSQVPPKNTAAGAPNLSNVDTSGFNVPPYIVSDPAPNNQRTNPITFIEFSSRLLKGNK